MRIIFIVFFVFSLEIVTFARQCNLPEEWKNLCNILESRVNQTSKKMQLSESEVVEFEKFLINGSLKFKSLKVIKEILPRTCIELIMGIIYRHVSFIEAEKMGEYLKEIVDIYKFKNVKAFDNNTSHIIGREWCEIDYSGEGLTWESQKKYAPYNVKNFKTLENLKKFFPIESKFSYFTRIYKPSC